MASTANTPTTHSTYVSVDPSVCGGRPCIAGTRIRVWDVGSMVQAGQTVDEVIAAYPRLSLAQVYGALAHFYDHRAEIERQAEDEREFVEATRSRTGPGPLEASEPGAQPESAG